MKKVKAELIAADKLSADNSHQYGPLLTELATTMGWQQITTQNQPLMWLIHSAPTRWKWEHKANIRE